MAMSGLLIGDIAERTGLSAPTIRYYESIGLLAAPQRSATGYRRYTETTLEELRFIKKAQALGFSLDEIRTLLRLGGPEKATCREVRDIAAHHLEDVRSKLRDLQKLEHVLTTTVSRCSGRTAPDCPVLDILDIERSKL